MTGPVPHPCLRCGACCCTFRVSFYFGELIEEDVQVDALADQPAVPAGLAEQVHPFRAAMRGTLVEPVRCVALQGAVGGETPCAIYRQRPSPCRDFVASYADGQPHAGCDKARARHGLAPLSPADWVGVSVG
ncbi:MAG: hypothetical protein RL071_2155 [Pseudomonadota bacterium]